MLILVSGCVSSSLPAEINSSSLPDQVERIEVYHFHRTQQCYNCRTLGALAEETVGTRFQDEMKSGKIVFGHINIELPENRDLVERYGPTGSSLWIGVYNGTGFHKEEDTRVWYKLGDREEYITYLSGLIQRRMNGDFT